MPALSVSCTLLHRERRIHLKTASIHVTLIDLGLLDSRVSCIRHRRSRSSILLFHTVVVAVSTSTPVPAHVARTGVVRLGLAAICMRSRPCSGRARPGPPIASGRRRAGPVPHVQRTRRRRIAVLDLHQLQLQDRRSEGVVTTRTRRRTQDKEKARTPPGRTPPQMPAAGMLVCIHNIYYI